MLAVKSALADKDDIGTVIYDEIDTGVSGLAAGRIGEKLKQTAQGRQSSASHILRRSRRRQITTCSSEKTSVKTVLIRK